MRLSEYLAARGACKALTKIEAEAFGVPYPLRAGWPRQHGHTEITAAMLDQIRASASGQSSGTAARALRGVDAGMGIGGPVVRKRVAPKMVEAPSVLAAPSFHGFRLRGQVTTAGRRPWE